MRAPDWRFQLGSPGIPHGPWPQESGGSAFRFSSGSPELLAVVSVGSGRLSF